MSDYLTDYEELFIDILLRLPIKSIVQCAFVCKSWHASITSPTFIAAHLNHNTHKPHRLLHCYSQPHGKELYSLCSDDETFELCRQLECPSRPGSGNKSFRLVGSCNGLLCLSDDRMELRNIIVVWNPMIQRSITLPEPGVVYRTHGSFSHVVGFGFDEKSHDYKVVRIVKLLGLDCGNMVELYSLRTGFWRALPSTSGPYYFSTMDWSHALLNGVSHWVVWNSLGMLIMLFDYSNEVVGEMMLPESLPTGLMQRIMSISVIKGSLSVLMYDGGLFFESKDLGCSIWMMKEYGVAKSWTELFRVDLRGHVGRVLDLRKNGEILLSIRDGERGWVLTEEGYLVSYHPETKQVKWLGVSGDVYSFHSCNYKESLVLLDVLKGQVGSCDSVGALALLEETTKDGDGDEENESFEENTEE